MEYSNQVRELIITKNGMQIFEISTGPKGILTGSEPIRKIILDLSNEEKVLVGMGTRPRIEIE